MGETPRDDEMERLVERQARGEPTGLPVEGGPSESGELDTRRSKSGVFPGSILGQTVHVDIPTEHLPMDPGHNAAIEPHQPVYIAGREVDVAYPDAVDTPQWIEAHMQPGAGADATLASPAHLVQSPETPTVGEAPDPNAILNANQFPDQVDTPAHIAGTAGAPAGPGGGQLLAEERPGDTQLGLGQSPQA